MSKSPAKHDEVDAMRQVSAALEPLAPDQQVRVLRWAAERFALLLAPASDGRQGTRDGRPVKGGGAERAEDPGEFYAQAAPESEPERALVIAYWVQEVRGDGEFEAQTVNTQLKH